MHYIRQVTVFELKMIYYINKPNPNLDLGVYKWTDDNLFGLKATLKEKGKQNKYLARWKEI